MGDTHRPPRACFIIAEAGVNHNGDVDLARRLVDVALSAGADAVKFQTFHTESLVTRSSGRAPYQKRSGISPQHEMLASLELSYSDFESLKYHCDECGIEFMSTPYDEEAVGFLKGLNVRRIKVASADIVNRPLLEAVVQSGLPVLQSTGMATLSEVERAVGLLSAGDIQDITLLHCVSSYPLDSSQVNMRWMGVLRQAFGLPVGYSDHTAGIEVPIMAASLGAVAIEKHFTLDRGMQGPDHAASLEPDELKRMVQAVRNVEVAFGDASFGLAQQEVENVVPMRRSLHAARPIRAGQVIRREDLAVLRPYVGLDPWLVDLVVGRRSRVDIGQEQPITWDVI